MLLAYDSMRHYMNRLLCYIWGVLFTLLILVPLPAKASYASPAAPLTCTQSDSLILVEFYHATGGPNWTNRTNWLVPGQPISTWQGITTNSNGCVTAIKLPNNNLINQIPSALGGLTELVELIIHTNAHLTGVIPDELGLLSNLTRMNISQCSLMNTIPATFGQLSNLRELYLNENQLDSMPDAITQLSNLVVLNLSRNKLDQALPQTVNGWTSLQRCFFNNNLLRGNIPSEFSELQQLRLLNLSINRLTGAIPETLANMPAIDSLYLNNNMLSGCIPRSFLTFCGEISQLFLATNPELSNPSWFNFCNFQAGICGECDVTNTNDTGPGSLRNAILCANNNIGPDTIRFNIAGAGPHIIFINDRFPILSDDYTVIDATTQPGWQLGNVVVDGSNMTDYVFTFEANERVGIEVYGLTLRHTPSIGLRFFRCDAIKIGMPGKGCVFYGNGRSDLTGGNQTSNIQLWGCTNSWVKNCRLGVTENNTTVGYQSYYCLEASGTNIEIGGSISMGEGNIVGNCTSGIDIWSDPMNNLFTTDIRIRGNSIGTNPNGTANWGNEVGINTYEEVRNIQIGGDNADYTNTIKYNETGVAALYPDWAYRQISLLQNSFSCNDEPILLCECADPSRPVLISSATSALIMGTAVPGDRVEVFESDDTDCSGAVCQGTHYLGSATANASGQWALNGTFEAGIRVTATGTGEGITWGFAPCQTVCPVLGTTITPSGSTSLCVGGSIVLDAPSVPAYTYQWQRNGSNISNATSASYTASQPGDYRLVVNQSGCTDTTAVVTISTLPTALTNVSETLCLGEDYLFAGQLLTTNGLYYDTLTTTQGCDSVIALQLQFVESADWQPKRDVFSAPFGPINHTFSIVENDGLPLANWYVVLEEAPIHGTAILSETGSLMYTPDNPGSVIDSLTYQLCSVGCDNFCQEATVLIQLLDDCLSNINRQLPNAFSPDGDQINDIFDPLAAMTDMPCVPSDLSQARLTIFNRWGEIIFRSNDYPPVWNGLLYNGKPASPDAYFYQLDLRSQTLAGFIRILEPTKN